METIDIIKIVILLICLPASLAVLIQLLLNLKRFRARDFDVRYLTTDESPTVTVCIPVRNENHAIRDCLERVLASNYTKMEVIVLDDDSVDNTPEIVKIFARDGVRFVKGETLPEGWIGKNKANDQMMKQASGQYILFLSADTDIKPDSISRLIAHAERRKLDMIGVMPVRLDGQRLSTFLAPMRYFWTIIFSSPKHPAHTTASWLVRRQALIENGGFEKYKSVIIPEARMSADFAKKNSYEFIVSDEKLGFSYEKRWSSQIDTAIRTFWPVNVRSGFSMLGILLMSILLWATILVSYLTKSFSFVDGLLIASALLLNLSYTIFAFSAWRKSSLLAFFVWPFMVIQDLCCLVASFIRHQSHSLVWKGRSLTDHID